MKVTIEHQVAVSEVDARFAIRMRPLVNFLQLGAGIHSARVGYGSRQLIERGHAWVLYRLAIAIDRTPVFGDHLELTTWHRGGEGFRAHREYEVCCNGQLSVAASSTWLFIDTRTRRLRKVPAEVTARYGSEPDRALETDLDGWRPDPQPITDTVTEVQTRVCDFDPIGHVNNAVYFDYIEEATRNVPLGDAIIRKVLIQYSQEISASVPAVQVGTRIAGDRLLVSLSSAAGVHASAELGVVGS